MFSKEHIAGLCNGSTPDSDSVCEGSNPSPAAIGLLRNRYGFGAFLISIAANMTCLCISALSLILSIPQPVFPLFSLLYDKRRRVTRCLLSYISYFPTCKSMPKQQDRQLAASVSRKSRFDRPNARA